MQFDVAALPAEDLEPLTKALSLAPPEKRGEVYMRIQNAGREFLAKATAGKPPSAATETDPIKRAVFSALTKQLPAPPPQLDPLKREALGSLEKAVLAGIRGAARGVGDLEKSASLIRGAVTAGLLGRAAVGRGMQAARGVGDALGVTGRAGAMRAMRGGYRQGYGGGMASARQGAAQSAEAAYRATAGKGVDTTGRAAAAAQAAHRESMKGGTSAARSMGRMAAAGAVKNFKRRRARTTLAGMLGVSAAAGAGATYAATRPRKQDQ